ncbi:MAG: DEAD/DEAH box helicase family protein [Betaproteobacteria bacterium]
MKLQFEHDLDYQLAAIDAVCDLFSGQEVCRTEFTVTAPRSVYLGEGTQSALPGMSGDGVQLGLGLAESDLGIGNRLQLDSQDLLSNLNKVQLRHGLKASESLASRDFTVEMETGTGKTYVYLRTIFELNKRYGFTKFVIVVPSVAIKEGVYKSLQIMAPHFRSLYSGQPFEYFLYDSAKLNQVRNFATSQHLQVMVVTVGAINKKDVNNLYKDSEKTGGEKPIDLIRATQPALIVDEPQSVDGGLEGRGKEALDAMNPLCTLRYSATHVDKHHMVYRLDAIDAYERQLVKQIEVASAEVDGGQNKAYVRLQEVRSKSGSVLARLELDVQQGGKVVRKDVWVQDGDDLEQHTGRQLYVNFLVGEIQAGSARRSGAQRVEIRMPGGEQWLQVDAAIGDIDGDAIKRQMIKRTIEEHLKKELRLRPQGIKVLSLFFIDKVDHYRQYNEAGESVKGKYALMFEQEFARLARNPDYQSLFNEVDLTAAPSEVHDGYFSVDKKGTWTDTAENNQGNRDNAERAYNLIMKDKERLLSFETPLKFIFSHSALREGWDSPNVFQICNLREMNTERERRQTIGRGLRLAVNQKGERLRGFAVNTLTVVANESYESFAENLQREIEQDTGIRFGIVESHQFAPLSVVGADGQPKPMGVDLSKQLWEHLKTAGLIDARGKVLDTLRKALKEDTLVLPDAFTSARQPILTLLHKLAGKLDIKDASKRDTVKLRRGVYLSDDFKALWDRIKHRTTYRVQFDNELLISRCANTIRQNLADAPVTRTRLRFRTATVLISQGGVDTKQTATSNFVSMTEGDIPLPDLLTELQDRTQLTRRSIVRMLTESGKLDDFKLNPAQFIDVAAECINRTKRQALVDGIKYRRLGQTADGSEIYAQELFEQAELTGYLTNMLEVTKSVHEKVVYQSDTERSFAEDLEKNTAVKLYAKLPGWFTVPTPLGNYNPDWAVVVNADGIDRLYFVVETKSTLFDDALRDAEVAKIACGREHFATIAEGADAAKFVRATSVDAFSKHW